MITGNSIHQDTENEIIQNEDVFLISEPDIYVKDRKNSRHVSFQSIADTVYQDIMRRFGSMVYEMSSDYSAIGHTHKDKYNHISNVRYVNYTPDTSKDLSIGQYFLDGRLSALYMPLSCAESHEYIIEKSAVEPKIGSYMFQTMGNLDSKTGWVLADGSEYVLDQYKHNRELEELYGNEGGKFKVPSLCNFLKIDSSSNNPYPTFQKYHVYTPDHVHKIDMNIMGDICLTASISCSGQLGDGKYGHNGTVPTEKNTKTIQSGKFNIKFKPEITIGKSTLKDKTIDNEVFPNHYRTSVYVYIGERI